MRRRTFSSNKNGFSLIELCITLAVLSILTGSVTSVFIKRVQIKAGEKTALEMSAIQQAAMAYFVANDAWPGGLTDLQSAGYLNNSWIPVNPWQNSYTVSSTDNGFTVRTSVPQEWSALVARDLPDSSVSAGVVTSTVPAPGAALDPSLPVGTIVMWPKSIAEIPPGWHLCDGTNGTIDLRDKFVVGARQESGDTLFTGVSGSLTQTGGEAYHTLTTSEMPSHTHQLRILYNDGSGAQHNSEDNVAGVSAGANELKWSSNSMASTGGGAAHNNLPPYRAIYFIMKIE